MPRREQSKKPRGRSHHLLEGSVIKSIFKISIPVIFANILQTLYQLIDTFWVGRLGEAAVAAVSLSFPILFFIISFATGFTMAGAILVAQYNGKGDEKGVSLSTGQTLSLVTLISLVMSTAGYFLSGPLLSLLTSDPAVLPNATSYLQISFLTVVAMFIYMVFQSSLRGVGEVKFPMIVILATVILNFFLDPLFMFGWKFIPAMGVAGVAWATFVTASLSALIGLFSLWLGTHGIKLRMGYLKLKAPWMKQLFRLGVPSSLEFSSRSFGMFAMIFVVSTLGTTVVAAYGIGARMLSFIIIPAVGFSIGTTALVGNNIGAKQYERADKILGTGMKIGFWTLLALGAVIFIFAEPINTFFVPGEDKVIALSTTFIRWMALTFGLIGMQMAIMGALKAAGKTTQAMMQAVFQAGALIIISSVLVFVLKIGEMGIWAAYPISNIVSLGLVLYFYFKRKEWLYKRIV
ncbi:MATE family efflux transporter [Candidatus Woesearchaeota archaeon]|nr:MATE family efflux transporter [Candidatus Woesearchaeota archaeon]